MKSIIYISLTDNYFINANIFSEEVIKMAKNTKQTSAKVASKAGKILRDGRYGKNAKSVAGSALSQAKPKKK
jgi:hypothetical protein